MQFDARAAKLLSAGEHAVVEECPGLRLEVSKTRRTWIYRFKSPVDGRMRQFKIGEWPAVSLAAATAEWERLRRLRNSGTDPAATKRAVRVQSRTEATNATKRKVNTVRALCESYLAGHVDRHRKKRGAVEVRRMFDTMLGDLAELPAEEITRSQAFDLINSYADRPVVAAKLRAELGGAWTYALDAGRLPETAPNWWRLIMHGRLRSKGRRIEGKTVGVIKRVLSADELGILIRWLPNFPPMLADVLTLYLWTGTRGSEIVSMEGRELTEEVDGLWWTIPKAKTKNARHAGATDLRVPLTGRAELVVRRLWHDAGKSFLFPSPAESGHVGQRSISVGVWVRMPYSHYRPNLPRLPVVRWAPHDLRRSSRTLLASMGCPDEIAEAILGHMKPGITGVYNRHTYDKERREWLAKLSDYLETLAGGPD